VSEKELCNSIIDFLNSRGCFCWRQNAGMASYETRGIRRYVRIGSPGISDIIGVYHDPKTKIGRFIALEVKLPKTRKSVTIPQLEFIAAVKRCGGISGVVCSPEESLDLIKNIEKPHP